MPVTTLFTSAATFLYAVSSLLGGAQQNGGYRIQLMSPARQGFPSDPPRQFTPPLPEAQQQYLQSMQYEVASPSAQPNDIFTFGTPYQNQNQYQSSNQNQNPPFPRRDAPAVSESLIDFKTRTRGLVSLLTYRPGGIGGERNASPATPRDSVQRGEEEAQAMATLRQIVGKSIPLENSTSIPIPDEITYYEKETIATLFLDPDGNVTRCRLIEVVEPEDARRVLQMIAERQKRIETTSFGTMLTLITACQGLDPRQPTPMTGQAEDVFGENNEKMFEYASDPNMNYSANPNMNMWSIVSGILPGTKWCGLGDISANYDDLGPERDLDKCCRAHDHCPIKVKAFRSRYGLVNWSIYTKSHCECDSLFFECLKKAAIPTAELLGNFYFNILRVQCVDDEDPTKCGARDPSSGACKLWVPDNNQPSRMLFRNVRRNF